MNRAPLSRVAIVLAAGTSALLCIPLVAMRFTSEVNWGVEDVIAGFVLIFATGMACAVASRLPARRMRRVAACAAIVCVAALAWAELAVGVFG